MRTAVLLLSALAIAVPPPLGAQGTCGAPLLGQPCAQGGIATAGNPEPSLNLGVGNPVHLATGNKHQREIDLPYNASTGLALERTYNSLDPRRSVLGQGWRLSYDTQLFFAASQWQIVQADGSRVSFANANGRPQPSPHGTLEAAPQGWLWRWPTGRRLLFDAGGLLQRIDDERGTSAHVERHGADAGPLSGLVRRVRASTGATLDFHYRNTGGQTVLERVDTLLGPFRYGYEPAGDAAPALRLVSATRPDGMARHYHYQRERQAGNAFALTGIDTVAADGVARRFSGAWAYDAQARAIQAIPSQPGRPTLYIDYRVPAALDPSPDAGTAAPRSLTAAPGSTSVHLTRVATGADRRVEFEISPHPNGQRITGIHARRCAACPPERTRIAYDAQGRLAQLPGLRIGRDEHGRLRSLQIDDSGWQGLRLTYQADGRRESWSSALTGTETLRYNAQRLPAERNYANGDTSRFRYDARGRPIAITEQNANGVLETRLQWRGSRLQAIHHPNESETRHHDAHGRIIRRDIARRSALSSDRLAYREGFAYDSLHRLQRHDLPEGGALHYSWSDQGRLVRIDWEDASGKRHAIIRPAASAGDTPDEGPGYEYGNGLRMTPIHDSQGRLRRLALTHDAQLLWAQDLEIDDHGRIAAEHHTLPHGRPVQTWRYAYDSGSRLAGMQRLGNTPDAAADPPIWHAWHEDGASAARREFGNTSTPSIERDASGLPSQVGDRRLAYGPDRRLAEVWRQETLIARYWHNAMGHRISRQSDAGNVDYFYLDNRVVAESRQRPVLPSRTSAPVISRRYVYASNVLVAVIDYATGGPGSPGRDTLTFVHGDHLGAPRLATDATRRIRWLAEYDPLGSARRVAGDLTLDLRLPGQVFDEATGWHDNLLRTYLPEAGHYLEPDPLGPLPGHQALGYTAQQPRRYVDPMGLLLFAFDGTRQAAQNQSNVWKLSQNYRDGPVFYHAGPGQPGKLDWDAVTAWRADSILDTQWQSLLKTLQAADKNDVVPIDIIGFSRGAAMARHFGNLIQQNTRSGLFSYRDGTLGAIDACVDLRFMGLFDTVAQFGVAGSRNPDYDLGISAAWDWVAHAVALHERRWLFPLSSVGPGGSSNTIEAPLIGAHADIGGGIVVDDEGKLGRQGDLSDVALNWMLWQARAAMLQFGTLPASDTQVTDPILHDERSPATRYLQDGDRRIDAPDGKTLLAYQDHHDRLGRTQRQATETLIQRHDNWRIRPGNAVGRVDMDGYAAWLQAELGWHAMPGQGQISYH